MTAMVDGPEGAVLRRKSRSTSVIAVLLSAASCWPSSWIRWLIPVVFMAGIGMAILLQPGHPTFSSGQISYITKALSAVLQLGVTMDYSIFLWHSYKEQRQGDHGGRKPTRRLPWPQAVANTITSVVGSSITTVAGFHRPVLS